MRQPAGSVEKRLQAVGALLRRLAAALDRHQRIVVVFGALASVAVALWTTSAELDSAGTATQRELGIRGDVRNLYYAASAADWSDIPRWFVGPWNSPGVGYYRPLTSILFFLENRAFGTNFSAYNRVGWLLHGLNALLLYSLAISLLRQHPRSRVALAFLAAYLFATPASSLYFGVRACVTWWPAQNDSLSLAFGLLCLLTLDRYLVGGKRMWYAGAIAAYVCAIGAKEMGFIALPMAVALVLWRRLRPTRVIAPFVLAAAFFWLLRRIVVPNPWAQHMFPPTTLTKLAMYWLEPIARPWLAGDHWVLFAGAAFLALVLLAVRLRWRVTWTIAVILISAGICAQSAGEPGSWAILFIPIESGKLVSLLLFVTAPALFYRYHRDEPGLPVAAMAMVVYVPILQFAGYHYFYWPGAFNALAIAVYWACAGRWVAETLTRYFRANPSPVFDAITGADGQSEALPPESVTNQPAVLQGAP